MNTKYLAVAALSVAILNPFSVSAQGRNGVAAVVNGETIKVEEIKKVYDETPQISNKETFEVFYPKALDVWINSVVLRQGAKRTNVQNSKEYKEQLALIEKDLAGKIYLSNLVEDKISDESLSNLYEKYKSEFQSEKEINARHILVDDEKVANEIVAKLKKGEDFSKLAQEYSKEQEASLGWFTKNMMVPEFGEAAFKMRKGQYSREPIKTQFGYHLIFVDDIRTSKPMEFEKIAPQLKAVLTQQATYEVFEEINNNAKVEKYELDGKVMQ